MCRDFVVLVVPMTLTDFPPYAKGTPALKVNVKCCENDPKLSNLHENHTMFSKYTHMFALLIRSVSYKKNDVVFGKKSQIENVPWGLYKSNQCREFVSAVPFSSAAGGVSAVTEWPATARIPPNNFISTVKFNRCSYLRFSFALLGLVFLLLLLGVLKVVSSLQLSQQHDVEMNQLLESHLTNEGQES